MVSGQVLQSTIEGFGSISGHEAAVYDIYGKVIASTVNGRKLYDGSLGEFIAGPAREMKTDSVMLSKLSDEQDLVYIVCVKGTDDRARTAAQLITFQLEQLLVAYKDKYDKDNFVKNLLLDNLLVIDIYSRAKKLHINLNVKRAVLLVETKGRENSTHDAVKKYFSGKPGDFVTTVDEANVIIIHEIKDEDASRELRLLSKNVLKAVNESGINTRVSYGTVVSEIKEVSKSYKEAKLALDVGKIFYEGRDIVAYNNLGIGRLIYQLPLSFCRMFIEEIFEGKSPDEFDEETLTTIYKFFENNLNVSETSRQLFIHRNTLVYRLDKLQKNTGLDLRVFDDAITFKIALMVVKYMDYMDKIDY